MKKYTLDNVRELIVKLQEDTRKLRRLANEQAVGIDRALLRLENIARQNKE